MYLFEGCKNFAGNFAADPGHERQILNSSIPDFLNRSKIREKKHFPLFPDTIDPI